MLVVVVTDLDPLHQPSGHNGITRSLSPESLHFALLTAPSVPLVIPDGPRPREFYGNPDNGCETTVKRGFTGKLPKETLNFTYPYYGI
jgi:hypothetical protein